jgi:ribosomal protein S3
MNDILIRIKRAVLAGQFVFSEKAQIEMEIDNITDMDVAESILNAVAIYKTIRSRSHFRKSRYEKLHIIQSTNLEGLPIYSKGKLVHKSGRDIFYFLLSSKRAL